MLKMLLNEAGYVSIPDRKFHFYLKDHQGNVRVVADKGGNMEETNAYYPFGELSLQLIVFSLTSIMGRS